MTSLTPGQQRVAAATAARKRNSEERLADRLRARGWTCEPPGTDDSDHDDDREGSLARSSVHPST